MKTRLQDKRVKKYLVLDTETTTPIKLEGFTRNQLVFDIGYQIVDKKGNVFLERSYVIEEIFYNKDYMQNAYYWEKYPQYLEGIKTGKYKVIKWYDMLVEIHNLMIECNVSVVGAYNLAFDLNTIDYTNRTLRNKPCKIFDKVEKLCIMGMSVETLCQQKTFQKLAMREGWISESGKFLSTKAETVYKYVTNQMDYKEEHTGLEDVKIEVELMALCFRQHKKMSKGIVHSVYKKVDIIKLGLEQVK